MIFSQNSSKSLELFDLIGQNFFDTRNIVTIVCYISCQHEGHIKRLLAETKRWNILWYSINIVTYNVMKCPWRKMDWIELDFWGLWWFKGEMSTEPLLLGLHFTKGKASSLNIPKFLSVEAIFVLANKKKNTTRWICMTSKPLMELVLAGEADLEVHGGREQLERNVVP